MKVYVTIMIGLIMMADIQATELREGRFALTIGTEGMAGDLQQPNGKVVHALTGAGEIRYGAHQWPLNQPMAIQRDGGKINVTYKVPSDPEIQVSVTYQLQTHRD